MPRPITRHSPPGRLHAPPPSWRAMTAREERPVRSARDSQRAENDHMPDHASKILTVPGLYPHDAEVFTPARILAPGRHTGVRVRTAVSTTEIP